MILLSGLSAAGVSPMISESSSEKLLLTCRRMCAHPKSPHDQNPIRGDVGRDALLTGPSDTWKVQGTLPLTRVLVRSLVYAATHQQKAVLQAKRAALRQEGLPETSPGGSSSAEKERKRTVKFVRAVRQMSVTTHQYVCMGEAFAKWCYAVGVAKFAADDAAMLADAGRIVGGAPAAMPAAAAAAVSPLGSSPNSSPGAEASPLGNDGTGSSTPGKRKRKHKKKNSAQNGTTADAAASAAMHAEEELKEGEEGETPRKKRISQEMGKGGKMGAHAE